MGAWRRLAQWLENTFVVWPHAHVCARECLCVSTSARKNTRSKVMGLQCCLSAKGDTLKCHLSSWDAIYSLALSGTRTCTRMHTLCASPHPTMSCSPSTQTDMRAAGNQQSGTMSLGVSTLEELLEQQEVAHRAAVRWIGRIQRTTSPVVTPRDPQPPYQQYAVRCEVGPRSIWTVT